MFQVFCVVIIYLAIINFIGAENMSRQFVYFMIANCIGGTIITILLLVYDIPPGFQFLQHDGRTGFFYYLTFTNTVFNTDGFTIIRYSGLFDEPGTVSFGCMFALILNKLILKNRKSELLLLILPLFTFSLAHFITSVLYVLLFYWSKTKLISSFVISLLGLYLLINSTKGTEYSRIYDLTLARLEINDEGELSGNSRKDETESCLKYFKQNPIIGWGKTYFSKGEGKGDGVNGTNIYYNGALYGILGFIFPYIFIYYITLQSLLLTNKSLCILAYILLIILMSLFIIRSVNKIMPIAPTLENIEAVLDNYVRPSLASHQGNVVVVDYSDNVLRIRLTGKCSGCPSAQLTTEELISATVKEHIPAIEDVILVSGVSDELIAQAKALLKNGHL